MTDVEHGERASWDAIQALDGKRVYGVTCLCGEIFRGHASLRRARGALRRHAAPPDEE